MAIETILGRIRREGVVDDAQISCIADELIKIAGEGVAAKFVNKTLSVVDMEGIDFPKRFRRDRFETVNEIWLCQKWVSHHRLAGALKEALERVVPEVRSPVDSALNAERVKMAKEVNALKAQFDDRNADLLRQIEQLKKQVIDRDALAREVGELKLSLGEKEESLRSQTDARDEAEKELGRIKSVVSDLQAELKKTEKVLDRTRGFLPEDVVAIADEIMEVLPLASGLGARRVVYSYLALIMSNPIEEGTRFANRFKLFDDELYLLLRNSPEQLHSARVTIARDLNPRLNRYEVSWDFQGAQYDATKFSTSDSTGNIVKEVLSALICDKADPLDIRIYRKAKVRTTD